ncbi:unnamed protein product [Hydatigera taeniaeformis]|uniref:START domain-containing protein n=1 Tax=Hydatigena taeniaeformis TaxID=6205 RepID=A0A0R3X0E8_HYDTA|nr:unnamed protein product [Hydatigera taeniaeformis]
MLCLTFRYLIRSAPPEHVSSLLIIVLFVRTYFLITQVNFIRGSIFRSPQFFLMRRCSDVNKFKCFPRMMRQVFLAKLFTLRNLADMLFKRIGEVYRYGCFSFHQELAASKGQRILLGACLISFAQDSISEDEMMITVEAFDVAKYNELLKFTQKSRQKEEEKSSEGVSRQSIVREYSSLESPLTFYVRDLRHFLRERQHEFFRTFFASQKENLIPSIDSTDTPLMPASSPRGVMLIDLSSRLSTDGTGFVDSEWECVIDRPDLRMWRRPSCKNSNGSSKMAVGLYEYRVCGTFSDISALCFLEVQLNLAYRRYWDKSVVVLESKKSANAAGSEVIRWVARFPFPLARREYIYARRWWLTTTGVGDQSLALIISRVSNMQPTDSAASITVVPQDAGWANDEESQSGGGLVSVRSYESNMLIRSHGTIDEPGMDYFLIYLDDPQLVLSTGAASRLSSAVIPRLLDGLHSAALTISTKGLPDTIRPVVLRSSQSFPSDGSTFVANPDEASDTSHSETMQVNVENPIAPITTRVYRFFFHS